MASPGKQPRSIAGFALDSLVRKWVDSAHQKKKDFTVAVNGPERWRAFTDIDLHVSLNFKHPVVLRFVLNDQPPNITKATEKSLKADYEILKHGNLEQDFIFLLVRKAAPVPDGYRVVKIGEKLTPNLRELLKVQPGTILYQPQLPSADASSSGEEQDRAIQMARSKAFAEHFGILSVVRDIVSEIADELQCL